MRNWVWRLSGTAGLIAALGAVAVAQPAPLPPPAPVPVVEPPPADDPLALERAKLQGQLQELLKRLNERPPAPGYGPVPAMPPGKKFEFPEGTRPVDSLRLAMNLFRDNDFDAALRACRLIDPATLSREDRTFVQYMSACCLRRLGKRGEAAVIYREVADAREDEFVAECAVWQLALIRSSQELEAQLEQLRSRPKTR